MIGLRRAHPWLATGHLEVEKTANHQLVYSVSGGAERVVVAIDLDDAQAPVRISAGGR
jgi:hypothetical protein